MQKAKKRISVATKSIAIVTIIVLILSIAIPVFFLFSLLGMSRDAATREANNVSSAIASSLIYDILSKERSEIFKEQYDGYIEATQKSFHKIANTDKYNKIFIITEYDQEHYMILVDEHNKNYIHPTHLEGYASSTLVKKSAYSSTLAKALDAKKSMYDTGLNDNGDNYILTYYPAISSQGELIGAVCIDMKNPGFMETCGKYLFQSAIFVILFNILGLIIYGLYQRRTIVNPLIAVAKASAHIAENDTEFELNISNNDEIGDIAHLINFNVRENVLKLNDANNKIRESIEYATKIEQGVLPEKSAFSVFSDSATRWLPRDVVGGDFYFVKTFAAGTVVAVGDCTGHGIPGALMAVMCSTTLNNLVDEHNCTSPKKIIESLDAILYHMTIKTKSEREIQDGLDIAVMFFPKSDDTLYFAGTNLTLFHLEGEKVSALKGDRKNVGEGKLRNVLKTYMVSISEKSTFFLATDGLYDQVGEATGLPLGYKAIKEYLSSCNGKSCESMAEDVLSLYASHKGAQIVRDDVTVVVIKPNYKDGERDGRFI